MISICSNSLLNHKEILNHLERISSIEKCIDNYNWKNIKFLSEQKIGKDLKKIDHQSS